MINETLECLYANLINFNFKYVMLVILGNQICKTFCAKLFSQAVPACPGRVVADAGGYYSHNCPRQESGNNSIQLAWFLVVADIQ